MSNAGFRIFVDLSNFFSDYRSRTRIFIDDNIETMGHLQHKIKELFCIRDFVFVCNNEYLPFTEKIGILQPEETIWVIPSSALHEESSKIKKSKLKRKASTTEDIISSYHSEKKRKKEKLVAENHIVTDELPENDVNESVEQQDSTGTKLKKEKKKKKDKKLKTPEDSDPQPEQTSLPNSTKLEPDSPKKPEYVCKGNLASYKKKIPVPMITDQYLKKKKINIIKIEVLKNGLQPMQQDNASNESNSLNFSTPISNPFLHRSIGNSKNLNENYNGTSPLNKAREVVSQDMQAEVPYFENSQRTGAGDIPEVGEEIPLNTKDSSQKSLPEKQTTESLMNGDQEMIEAETKLDDGDPNLNNHEPQDLLSVISDDVASINSSIRLGVSKHQLAGVGPVLEQLRNTSGSTSATESQVPRERQRKRVRKRKKKEVVQNDTPTPLPKSAPIRIKGCPSIHIKFKDEENGNLGDEELEETASEITVNDKEQWKIQEEDVMKSQLMKDLKPKVGDMIAFKVVRITESYTPEISSYIVGLVEEIENDEILLNITSGLDQCVLPKGKLTIENEAEEITTHQRFNWQSLLETRLLFP